MQSVKCCNGECGKNFLVVYRPAEEEYLFDIECPFCNQAREFQLAASLLIRRVEDRQAPPVVQSWGYVPGLKPKQKV